MKWEEGTLRAVEKQLATFIGPLARIIVKKAASKATNLDQLYSLVVQHLQREDERQAFLAGKAEVIRSGAQSEPPRVPLQARSAAAPANATPIESNRTPELKPAPKPDLKSGPTPAAKPELPSGAKPDVSSVKSELKPEAKADLKQRSAPAEAASGAAPGWEELLGKQPQNLAGYLKDGSPQLEEVIPAFIASVEALVAMYAANCKNEPLTPESICFDRFGKATIRSSQPAVTQRTGSVAGNPRYAVPEIFAEKGSGAESTIAVAHVYALGVMFYEILLGRKLFEKTFANQRTDLDWLRWHANLESKAPPLKAVLPDCPAGLSDLLESMMEKHAEKRTADLEKILSTLRGIAQRANKTIVLRKPTAAAIATARTPTEPRSIPRKKGGKKLTLVLLIILALAAGGVLLWLNPDLYREVISHFYHPAQTP